MTQGNTDAAPAYERAGVNIDAGHRAVALMEDAVALGEGRDLLGEDFFVGGVRHVGSLAHWAIWVISNGCGCCAAWGCSGPA